MPFAALNRPGWALSDGSVSADGTLAVGIRAIVGTSATRVSRRWSGEGRGSVLGSVDRRVMWGLEGRGGRQSTVQIVEPAADEAVGLSSWICPELARFVSASEGGRGGRAVSRIGPGFARRLAIRRVRILEVMRTSV